MHQIINAIYQHTLFLYSKSLLISPVSTENIPKLQIHEPPKKKKNSFGNQVASEGPIIVTQEGLHCDSGIWIISPRNINADGAIQKEAQDLRLQTAADLAQALVTLLLCNPSPTPSGHIEKKRWTQRVQQMMHDVVLVRYLNVLMVASYLNPSLGGRNPHMIQLVSKNQLPQTRLLLAGVSLCAFRHGLKCI